MSPAPPPPVIIAPVMPMVAPAGAVIPAAVQGAVTAPPAPVGSFEGDGANARAGDLRRFTEMTRLAPARAGHKWRDTAVKPRSHKIMDLNGKPYIVVGRKRTNLISYGNDVFIAALDDGQYIYLRKNGERLIGTKETPVIIGMDDDEALIDGETFWRHNFRTVGRSVVVSLQKDRAYVYDRHGRLVDMSADPVFFEFDKRSEHYKLSYDKASREAKPDGMIVSGETVYEVRKLDNGYIQTRAKNALLFNGDARPYYSGLKLEQILKDDESRLVAKIGRVEVHRSNDRIFSGQFLRRDDRRSFSISKPMWKEGVIRNEYGDPLIIVTRTHRGRRGYVVFPELTEGDIVYGLDIEHGHSPAEHWGWKMFKKAGDSFVPLTPVEIEARFGRRVGNRPMDSAFMAPPDSAKLSKIKLPDVISSKYSLPDRYVLDLGSRSGERHRILIKVRGCPGHTSSGAAGDGGKGHMPNLEDLRAVIAGLPFRLLKKAGQILLSDEAGATGLEGSWHADEILVTLFPLQKPWTRERLANVLTHELGHSFSCEDEPVQRSLIEASIIDGGKMEKLMNSAWGTKRYHTTALDERIAELITLYFYTIITFKKRTREEALLASIFGQEQREFKDPDDARKALRNNAPHILRLIEHILQR